jgi:hypothetical protein
VPYASAPLTAAARAVPHAARARWRAVAVHRRSTPTALPTPAPHGPPPCLRAPSKLRWGRRRLVGRVAPRPALAGRCPSRLRRTLPRVAGVLEQGTPLRAHYADVTEGLRAYSTPTSPRAPQRPRKRRARLPKTHGPRRCAAPAGAWLCHPDSTPGSRVDQGHAPGARRCVLLAAAIGTNTEHR